MSSGVSDQMKVPGNTAKNVEERNIPWSQQVDEASYENLASPTTDDNSAGNQSSMQFQYPPFNAKETTNSTWNNYKSRKTTNNFEANKKHGKPAFYSNNKRDDFQPNAWGTHNSRKTSSDNSGNVNRSNRSDDDYASLKLDNRPSVNATTEEKKSAPPAMAAPKKTTWASIASQPAKLTSRTTLTTSSHKKKGPGMPPPPMVPGKHNLDVNTWDLPNNNPAPVPSPPPPIDQPYTETNPEFSTIIGSEHDLGARPEKGHKGMEFSKDDNKSNYNNSNFGRVRSSPNGHSRKNWSTQHPLHQNRQPSGMGTPMRRNESNVGSSVSGNGGGGSGGGGGGGSGGGGGGGGGGGASVGNNVGSNSGPSGQNRYNDRSRGQYSGSRIEQDPTSYDLRDENSPRNTEQSSNVVDELTNEAPQAVLDELRDKNNYNPAALDLKKAGSARFFVIKSYSEDDIHRSIKYEIWCSTDHGNKRLDDAFKERHKEGGNILLFFSVNGSGHFCGMAQMMTAVDYNSTSSVWSQDKWKGKFKVKWIYVKDVPNIKLRHIRLENNENKSVTNSRDTQEVPNSKGIEVLQILHAFKHSTSIFDDFYHYEKKQEEEVSSKKPLPHDNMSISQTQSPVSRHYNRQNDDRDSRDGRDGRSGGAQKYVGGSGGGGGFGGGGFGGGGGGNMFRGDRNNTHRGGYHNNYNDHRRFDSHRTGDYQQKDNRDREDTDRENSEYGNRHAQKFDYNQRNQSKHINRERDFSEDHSKSESRFRSGPREMQKDNEYPNVDRVRGTDY